MADLHLDAVAAPSYRFALAMLREALALHELADLWILGDLFEAWIGDDAALDEHAELTDALRALAEHGCRVSLMHGNRDFLIGDAFAAAAGATLIRDDETVATLGHTSVLLLHGDTLCTDDHDYQQLRQRLRSRDWQSDFLARSAEERTAIARQLRHESRSAGREKASAIMDVNDTAVAERFRAHPDIAIMVHGHTHRPARHDLEVLIDGTPCPRQRLVVGDWHDDHAVCLVAGDDGPVLMTLKA